MKQNHPTPGGFPPAEHGLKLFQVAEQRRHGVVEGIGDFLVAEDMRLLDDLLRKPPKRNVRLGIDDNQLQERFVGRKPHADFKNQIGVSRTDVGFVTSTAAGEAGEKLGRKVCSLFIPSAVNPTTGFLLVVPEEKVTYLDMTPEQAMKMIVSAGALVPPLVVR